MRLKKFFLPFAAGALALGLAACNDDKKEDANGQDDFAAFEEMQKELDKQKIDKDKIVAIVNDEELDGDSYNVVLQNLQAQAQQNGLDPTSKEFVEELKNQTLDTLVNQTLILQQAKAEKIEVPEEEIENEYSMLVLQFGDEDTLTEALKEEGMDTDALKEQITNSILFQKYQDQVAPIEEATEDEVKGYYEDVAAQAEEGEELPPFEEVSENIKAILENGQQQEKLMAHLEELKKDAKIELKI